MHYGNSFPRCLATVPYFTLCDNYYFIHLGNWTKRINFAKYFVHDGKKRPVGIHPRGPHDDAQRATASHRAALRAQHPGADQCHGDVLHRCRDGGPLRREGHRRHRPGGDHDVADGRPWLGGEHGFLCSGGPLHRCQRLRGGPPRAAPVAGVLAAVELDAVVRGHRRAQLPALLAWRVGRHCTRCLALLHVHRHLRHLLPDGWPGGVDAEVLGQHEGAVGPEHPDVLPRRGVQLPIYIYPRPRRGGCCLRHRHGRACHRCADAVVPAGIRDLPQ